MGIVIVNESNDIINPVTHFKLIELWKLPIDVENWQESDLRAGFKCETDEKVIFTNNILTKELLMQHIYTYQICVYRL